MSVDYHNYVNEYREPCIYCNEYKGSHFKFYYRSSTIEVPYCSKKCFFEDGNTLKSNKYTRSIDQWIKSGGREKALKLEKEKLDSQRKENEQKERLKEQQEIARKNKKTQNDRLIAKGLVIAAIAGFGYFFFLYNPYSSEQMSKACDCADNSYENNQIPFDYLTPSEQRKRSDCFDLFKPEDFKLLKDDTKEIYDRMVDACNRSK